MYIFRRWMRRRVCAWSAMCSVHGGYNARLPRKCSFWRIGRLIWSLSWGMLEDKWRPPSLCYCKFLENSFAELSSKRKIGVLLTDSNRSNNKVLMLFFVCHSYKRLVVEDIYQKKKKFQFPIVWILLIHIYYLRDTCYISWFSKTSYFGIDIVICIIYIYIYLFWG